MYDAYWIFPVTFNYMHEGVSDMLACFGFQGVFWSLEVIDLEDLRIMSRDLNDPNLYGLCL